MPSDNNINPPHVNHDSASQQLRNIALYLEGEKRSKVELAAKVDALAAELKTARAAHQELTSRCDDLVKDKETNSKKDAAFYDLWLSIIEEQSKLRLPSLSVPRDTSSHPAEAHVIAKDAPVAGPSNEVDPAHRPVLTAAGKRKAALARLKHEMATIAPEPRLQPKLQDPSIPEPAPKYPLAEGGVRDRFILFEDQNIWRDLEMFSRFCFRECIDLKLPKKQIRADLEITEQWLRHKCGYLREGEAEAIMAKRIEDDKRRNQRRLTGRRKSGKTKATAVVVDSDDDELMPPPKRTRRSSTTTTADEDAPDAFRPTTRSATSKGKQPARGEPSSPPAGLNMLKLEPSPSPSLSSSPLSA